MAWRSRPSPFSWRSATLQIWELVVISAVFGAADALFYPAATAVTPEILPADLLVQGSALNHTSETVAQTAPRARARRTGRRCARIRMGRSSIDAASFAVSAGCVLAMSQPAAPRALGPLGAR